MKPDVKEIYCDNHLLVLVKPSGMLTQPNDSPDLSLEEFGKSLLKRRFQKPGNVFLEAVHRIDRPVSGLVLFARTSKALSRFQKMQREEKFEKEYHAIVEGEVKEEEKILKHTLIHDDFRAKIASLEEGGKLCRLKYSVIKKGEGFTLLRIILETGRYHQIRSQLSLIGHPVVGDHKYGAKNRCEAIFLHHSAFKVFHPVSGEELFFKAPFSSWSSDFPFLF